MDAGCVQVTTGLGKVGSALSPPDDLARFLSSEELIGSDGAKARALPAGRIASASRTCCTSRRCRPAPSAKRVVGL